MPFKGMWGKRSGQKEQFYSVQHRNLGDVDDNDVVDLQINDDDDAS